MNIPRPLRDHLFVRIDKDKLDRTETGLYIPDWQPGDKDAEQGEVVAVPISLSQERRLAHPGMDGQNYTYAHLQDLPQVGEIVYLKPNTFKTDMEYPGYPGVFLVALDKVIAIASKSGMPHFIEPFQGLLLCQEVYDDNVYTEEDGTRARIMFGVDPITPDAKAQAIVIENDPLPIPFTLRITHDGTPLKGQQNIVEVGDVIVGHRMAFTKHPLKNADHQQLSARWVWEPSKVRIEGTEYAYIPRQCVMAVLEKELQFFQPRKRTSAISLTEEKIEELGSKITMLGTDSGSYDAGKQSQYFNDEWGTMQRTD